MMLLACRCLRPVAWTWRSCGVAFGQPTTSSSLIAPTMGSVLGATLQIASAVVTSSVSSNTLHTCKVGKKSSQLLLRTDEVELGKIQVPIIAVVGDATQSR
jgi:hypothetical protein